VLGGGLREGRRPQRAARHAGDRGGRGPDPRRARPIERADRGAGRGRSGRPAGARRTDVVTSPQGGIFALGTASHAYLEFDRPDGRDGVALVAAVSSLREPRTTMGGVNLVVGFRPELWRAVASADIPADV